MILFLLLFTSFLAYSGLETEYVDSLALVFRTLLSGRVEIVFIWGDCILVIL